mmetsp:Transcript_33812/g.32892  ORF Transcript_33812/g.32892 Transcript_33812/m.32892 type:complete len:217 (+) Transcript_33812:1241-1891(+)
MEEPPVPRLEQRPNQYGVVAFAYEAFVELLGLDEFFLEDAVFVAFRLALLIDDFADVVDELLLEQVAQFPTLDPELSKYVPVELEVHLLGEVVDLVHVGLALHLEGSHDELVVVLQRLVDPVRLHVGVVVELVYPDLRRRVLRILLPLPPSHLDDLRLAEGILLLHWLVLHLHLLAMTRSLLGETPGRTCMMRHVGDLPIVRIVALKVPCLEVREG